MRSVVEIIIAERRTIINNIFNISPSKYLDYKHHYPENTLIIKCASFIFNIIRNHVIKVTVSTHFFIEMCRGL